MLHGAASTYFTLDGEKVLLIHGRREVFDGTSPGVLYCHGAAGTALEPQLYADFDWRPVHALAEAGFIILAGTWGGPIWGADGVVDLMAGGDDWLQNNGARVGPIGLWGCSMGFTNVATYADAEPLRPGAILGVVPVCDTTNVYDDNPSLQASMDAAYGGDFANNGADRSPHVVLPAIPEVGDMTLIRYSSDDVVCKPADALALATAIGAEVVDLEPADPGGHGAFASSSQGTSGIIDHFARNLR